MNPQPHIVTGETDLTHARIAAVAVIGNGAHPLDIVELGAVLLTGGQPQEPHTWLARPPIPISWMITQVHHIDNAEVADSPTIQELGAEIRSVLTGVDLLVGHGPRRYLEAMIRSFPGWIPPPILDTGRLARALLPGLELYDYRLPTLVRDLDLGDGLPAGHEDRDGWEAVAVSRLLLCLASRLHQPVTIAGLLRRGGWPAVTPDSEPEPVSTHEP